MPALANIRCVRFDPGTRAPEFEVDLGTNAQFRLDVATDGILFNGNQAGARNAGNFIQGGVIPAPGGGVHRHLVSGGPWSQLNLGAARIYYRVTTTDAAGGNVARSLALDQGANAPWTPTRVPDLTAVDPARGPLAGGTPVVLRGAGFTNATGVRFGASTAPSFQVDNEGQISTVAPAASAAGDVAITVTGLPGDSAAAPGRTFTYVAGTAPINRIEVTLPLIDYARPANLDGPFELRADTNAGDLGDRRPRTLVRIYVWGRDPQGQELPVPDGTEIRLGYVIPDASAPQQPPGFFQAGMPVAAQTARTTGGMADVEIRCEPVAEGWTLQGSGINVVAAATYRVTAASMDGSIVAQSPQFWITHGEPRTIVLIAPAAAGMTLADLLGPTGQPLTVGRHLATIKDVYLRHMPPPTIAVLFTPGFVERIPQMDFKLGGVAVEDAGHLTNLRPAPSASALLLLVKVVDAFGNVVAVHEGTDTEGYWAMVGINTYNLYGTRPFVISAHLEALDPTKTVWRCPPRTTPLPPTGVFGMYFVPSFNFTSNQTEFDLKIFKFANNTSVEMAGRPFRAFADPPAQYQKLSKWFFEGEIGSPSHFLGEIGLSLVPFVGDGRDLIIFGRQLIADRQLSDMDYVVAFMAFAGLLLDVANIGTLGGTLPLDAAVAGMKGAVKILRQLRNADAARQLCAALVTRIRGLVRMPDWSNILDFRLTPEWDDLIAFVREFRAFAEKFAQLSTIEKMENLLTLMGLVVTTVQLRDLLKLFEDHSVDEVMDLLWAMAKLNGEDVDSIG